MTRKEKLDRNPDPRKYAWRKRGDHYILVDKQILRWEARRRREAREARPKPERRDILNTKLFGG